MPTVPEALRRLEKELALARQGGLHFLKLIHGYGSSGAGGDIRIVVQKRLREMQQNGQLHGCIFGEDWSQSNEETWRVVQAHRALKDDPDLGRRNPGITIVLL